LLKYKSIFLTALLIFSASCALDPYLPVLRKEYFNVHENLDRQVVLSRIEAIELAVSSNPDDWHLRHLLAVYYKLASTPYYRNLAIREIDRAIELNPSYSELYMERGRINMARRFRGDAEDSFRKALEINPDNYEALCHLGSLKKKEYTRSMCFPVYAEEAADLYHRAAEIDTTRIKALMEISSLYLLLEMPEKALRYIRIMERNSGDSHLPHFLLGIVHLAKKNMKRSRNEFSESLELMPDSEKEFYLDISTLLSDEEYRHFRTLPDEWKKKYISNFWIARDPTPATKINERLLEHYRRIYYARYLFKNSRLEHTGPDTDRGRTLIRYGMPDKIHIPFDQRGIRPSDASVIAWSFNTEEGRFELYFLDEFLNGDYHIPIYRRYRRYRNVNLSIESLLPEAYSYPVEYTSFRLYSQVVQRRGRADNTSVLFSTSIPCEQVEQGYTTLRILFSIRDSNNNLIYSADDPCLADSMKIISKGGNNYFLLRRAVNLLPRIGNCLYHVTCIDSASGRRGTASGEFRFIDFSTEHPILSDIAVSLAGGKSSCGVWSDGRSVFPTGSRLCLCYTIYNLEWNRSHESRYRLTWSIIPFESDRKDAGALSDLLAHIRDIAGSDHDPFISNSITQNAYSPDVKGRLMIDTGSLKEDTYILKLDVTDLADGQSSSRERLFILTEEIQP